MVYRVVRLKLYGSGPRMQHCRCTVWGVVSRTRACGLGLRISGMGRKLQDQRLGWAGSETTAMAALWRAHGFQRDCVYPS